MPQGFQDALTALEVAGDGQIDITCTERKSWDGRRNHPHVGSGPLGVDQYLAMRHVLVKPEGHAHVFEQYLQQQGLKRDVALEISHFMSLPPIIESSD